MSKDIDEAYRRLKKLLKEPTPPLPVANVGAMELLKLMTGMRADVEFLYIAALEGERWAKRVKELERRLDCIVDVARGHK